MWPFDTGISGVVYKGGNLTNTFSSRSEIARSCRTKLSMRLFFLSNVVKEIKVLAVALLASGQRATEFVLRTVGCFLVQLTIAHVFRFGQFLAMCSVDKQPKQRRLDFINSIRSL